MSNCEHPKSKGTTFALALLLLATCSMSVSAGQANVPKTAAAAATPAGERDQAPDFALPSENGKTVKLSDFRGRKVVVFFYGTETTPVSPYEAEEIQKYYKKFKLADVDVLGIGPDPEASHKALATKLNLDYHLLTDKQDNTRKLFKLSAEKGRYGVVIDKNGVIRKIAGGKVDDPYGLGYVSDTYDWIMSTQGSGF
ncbi:MAG TPA: peroxiredoxin family protein [Oculatellaceae cyanobacterium]